MPGSDVERADVLVIEDNVDDAKITVRSVKMLRPTPSIRVIRDGEVAMRLATSERPLSAKVVFLDLKLPSVHGLDVLKALQGREGEIKPTIVILTSSDDPTDIERACELGCDEFLTKPHDWIGYTRLVCQTAAKYLPGSECHGEFFQ